MSRVGIAITGLGLVSPIGNSVSAGVANAFAGRAAIRSCEKYLWGDFGDGIACRVAGLVEHLEVGDVVPAERVATFDPAVLFALVAGEQALTDARLELAHDEERERVGVIIGCAGPGCHSYHRALHQAFVARAAHELPGYLSLQMSGNLAPSLIALRHGLRGPNFGIVNACAAGATAIATAAEMIQAGSADVMIAGGTDACIGLTLLGSMGNVGAINPTTDPHRASRPFSRDRAGLIMAEGAGIVVLERADHARARGARIVGELLGWSRTNDAHHVYNPEPSGARWARVIELALRSGGITASEVEVVSAHAASTPMGDLIETRALKHALGPRARQIPVSSTKSMHGHTYGAAGAIETILALAAMNRGQVLPTAHLEDPDPECDLDYVPQVGRDSRAEILLKNSFGFGGTNAALVIRRGEA